jgi:aspartate 4-decarboxylase
LLQAMVPWAVEKFGFDPDKFVHELVDSIIGDHYPVPDRMLVHNEQIVHEYLEWAMCGEPHPKGKFKIYAVEGGTAAMCYIFKSLKSNRLVNQGDTIAMGVPIFTPYIEMSHLEDYDLHYVPIHAKQENKFQYPDSEIDKLLDPKIKAFFVVNPGNPYAVSISPETIKKIGGILKKRPDLILLTDDVYGTFVRGFRSLMGEYPRNTIGVYSYSKYFGCTGWRLGTIALHEDNIFDEMIAKHPEPIQKLLDKRYGGLTLEPRKLAFIDRIVADSRDVALNHTAGLSTPQQVQMVLFSLFALLDDDDTYQKRCRELVRHRLAALGRGLGFDLPADPLRVGYYADLDLAVWGRAAFGDDFNAYREAHHQPLDAVIALAKRSGTVLLNGSGFDGPPWSVRISLANLDADAYEAIGRDLKELMGQAVAEWRQRKPRS